MPNILKVGVLQKQSPSMFRLWQEREFRLYPVVLAYSDSRDWVPALKQHIPLGRIEAINWYGTDFELVVNRDNEKRTYKLRANTETDAMAWVQAVQAAKLSIFSGAWSIHGMSSVFMTINGITLICPTTGTASCLSVQNGAVSMESEGKRVFALMGNGMHLNDRIHWSSGETWERCMDMSDADTSCMLGGRFKRTERIGGGCFGEVYLCLDLETHLEMAVKFEDPQITATSSQLENEAEILKMLTAKSGSQQPYGFTVPVFFFSQDCNCAAIVMPLLGKSLEDYLECSGGRFSDKTVLMLADQLTCRIEFLHSKGIIHRDIKPGNFMLGVNEKCHHVYVVDFGLSKRYYSFGAHIQFREGRRFTGTVRYASINSQLGYEQSRRDDLEAVGYVFAFLLLGALPWSGLIGDTLEARHEQIRETKQRISLGDILNGFPSSFATYIQLCRDFHFFERPDYCRMRALFVDDMCNAGIVSDYRFDWCTGAELAIEPLPPWIPPPQPDD